MVRLIKTRTEWEQTVHEEFSIVEGEAPQPWPPDARLTTIGKGEPPVDGRERVTGTAVYTLDVQLPGMLFARTLRSPHPHARITGLDISRAEKLAGVRAVITYLNVPEIAWWNNARLLEPVVRFVGDEVAVVAADSEAIAEEAIDLIEVDYDRLPFVLDAGEALGADAPRIHAEGNLVGGKARIYERGNVEEGFAGADVIVEETFHTQPALHNCLEPHGAVASWSGDVLTVWESTQAIHSVQEELAGVFGLPLSKVRVICEYMGGGFGSKQYTGKWSIFAALLARQAKRPVQLIFDRHEENVASGYRAPTIQHLKMGAKRDGGITAIELTSVSAIGAYGWGSLSIEGPAKTMYKCDNVRTEVRSAFTNTGPARSFRGPGYVEGMFPLESLMDELATRTGLDPLEIRLRNYAPTDPVSGKPYSAKHLDECYRKGAEMIGWVANGSTGRTDGAVRRAVGMASQTWGGGGGPPAHAWLKLNSDGTAEVITGSQDIGTGTKTVFAQIAAQELGMRTDQVMVRLGDTAAGPFAPVSWGSMTVSSVGPAVRQAAADAYGQLCRVTADFLGVPVDVVKIRDGRVYAGDSSKPQMELSDLTKEIGSFTILGKGSREANRTDVEVNTFGAQFAEVEVNTLTGEVKVVKLVTVHDFGRVMNPLGGRSQVEGAVVQGIGYALIEKKVVDARTGVVLNNNLADYLVPTVLDFGEIGHAFIDRPDAGANSIGAKGLGEPALIPTAPAIANAITRATGIRFLSLPLSRDTILEGIRRGR